MTLTAETANLFAQNDAWLAQDFPAPWYVRVWRALVRKG